MAPPRRAAALDDSRSEASNGPRESKGKGRRGGNGSAGAKGASNATGVTSVPAGHGQNEDLPRVPWPDMPLDILHSYRYAYKLDTPSAFSNDYSHLLLSRGIGLRSPTSLAARRAHLTNQTRGNNNGGRKRSSSPDDETATTATAAAAASSSPRSRKDPTTIDTKSALNQVIGQGRVNKNQLAMVVRKHFNNASLGEQEAVSRFLYKVREEGSGRQFRLRFQP